ncbi:hypothetical protein [Amnibacterium kyonggiense]|uniref:hypothetical protein n=1 Tax=Amnibacterium kyonggiense TaxID=595671 RepID=UPI00105F38AB|nr:hypothetical protein [Amnibacterium kyonggiense]
MDETPGGAWILAATSALTPASGVIAAVCFAAIGASFLPIAVGLRQQWRGVGVRPSLVLLPPAMVIAGFGAVVAVGGRLATVSATPARTVDRHRRCRPR